MLKMQKKSSKARALAEQKFIWNGQSDQESLKARAEQEKTRHTAEEAEAEVIVEAKVASIAIIALTQDPETAKEDHQDPAPIIKVPRRGLVQTVAVKNTVVDHLAAMIASIT